MKKMVLDRYGSSDVLELRDVELPQTDSHSVLIRVRAAALNPYDWHLMMGLPYLIRLQSGLRRPRISGIGADLAGQVAAVGREVTRVRPGDEVFGSVGRLAGTTLLDTGAVAEYVSVPEDAVRPRPVRLTAEEAAGMAMAGTTALWACAMPAGFDRGSTCSSTGHPGASARSPSRSPSPWGRRSPASAAPATSHSCGRSAPITWSTRPATTYAGAPPGSTSSSTTSATTPRRTTGAWSSRTAATWPRSIILTGGGWGRCGTWPGWRLGGDGPTSRWPC